MDVLVYWSYNRYSPNRWGVERMSLLIVCFFIAIMTLACAFGTFLLVLEYVEPEENLARG